MVYNLTKDGRPLPELKGRVVSIKEAAPVYNLVKQINTRGGTHKNAGIVSNVRNY